MNTGLTEALDHSYYGGFEAKDEGMQVDPGILDSDENADGDGGAGNLQLLDDDEGENQTNLLHEFLLY